MHVSIQVQMLSAGERLGDQQTMRPSLAWYSDTELSEQNKLLNIKPNTLRQR